VTEALAELLSRDFQSVAGQFLLFGRILSRGIVGMNAVVMRLA
jgi:hypothetical protein